MFAMPKMSGRKPQAFDKGKDQALKKLAFERDWDLLRNALAFEPTFAKSEMRSIALRLNCV
ncbi:MAG TPA: hypothetical protein PKG55_12480 [Acidobacteriota bacterium]|nr:hypothetical protein [Acidobacteriota bacterium]